MSLRSVLTLAIGCCALLVASLAIFYSDGLLSPPDKISGSKQLGARSCPQLAKTIRLKLQSAREQPVAKSDLEAEAALGAMAVRQTPSADCNRALEELIRLNRSDISYGSAFELTEDCASILLGTRVEFVSAESDRLRLMSQPLASWNTSHCFRRAILETEKAAIVERLSLVKRAFDKAKVPLILDGGSLIGSFRHHGFVPWDDDFDFRISSSDFAAAHRIFSRLAKRHPKTFDFWPEATSTHWKFYILDLRLQKAEVPDFQLCLDIFFYHEPLPQSGQFNLTDRWTLAPKSLYFPLSRRPFEGLWFAAPGNTPGYLRMYYGDVMDRCYYHCYSNLDSVSRCKSQGSRWQSCSQLKHRYPFVRRVPVGDSWLEFLLVGNQLLQTAFLTGRLQV